MKDGIIVSVSAGPAPPVARASWIDTTGMAVIAGYIDCHRHLIDVALGAKPEVVDAFLRDKAAARMRELIESGVTTVQSDGHDNAGILRLKQMVESGQIVGPRILSSHGCQQR